jgi:hypothetical protein
MPRDSRRASVRYVASTWGNLGGGASDTTLVVPWLHPLKLWGLRTYPGRFSES